MTTFHRLLGTVLVLSFVLVQSSYAQETPVATSTEDAPVVTENWYKSEQISGNTINVGDFVVGPGRAEVTVSPGETVYQEITVTNRIEDNKAFVLEIEDITGSSDASKAVSVVEGERGPYSVRDYISVEKNTLTLKLGERARIPVKISVPADAEPGGYYGSILVSTDRNAPADDTSTVPRSPIIARVGSLFFVTVRGDIEVSGETKSINTIGSDWWYEKGPVNLGILYENTGSLHVNPYGEVSVKNMFGEEVGFIQIEPWFVLPKSQRLREITWDREFLFGRYTVTAKINRGYEDIVDEVSTTFWVLPWKIVGGAFLILFIIIFTIRAFFRTFEFKRKS